MGTTYEIKFTATATGTLMIEVEADDDIDEVVQDALDNVSISDIEEVTDPQIDGEPKEWTPRKSKPSG